MGLPDETSLVCDKCGCFNFDNGIIKDGKIYCNNCGGIRKKIQEWNNLVNQGLVNGLTHTDHIEWVRKRLELWESFGRCVMDLKTNQDYQDVEKELKEVAEFGFKKQNKENNVHFIKNSDLIELAKRIKKDEEQREGCGKNLGEINCGEVYGEDDGRELYKLCSECQGQSKGAKDGK